MTRPSRAIGTHQGGLPNEYSAAAVEACIGSRPVAAKASSTSVPTVSPVLSQGQRRQAAVGVGRDQEVRRRADHRAQRPGDARPGQIGAGGQVEHEHQARRGDDGTDNGQRAGPLPAPQPEPADHGGWRRVLDEQGGRDVHGGDRGEVAELGARDGERAVHQDLPGLAPQQMPPAAQRGEGEGRQRERGDRHPAEHDRAGAPAGAEQPGGQRPGQAETGRGDDGEQHPAADAGRGREDGPVIG
nr:hypothetical protein GCM10020092_046640 [Actinoplanes digitatis]